MRWTVSSIENFGNVNLREDYEIVLRMKISSILNTGNDDEGYVKEKILENCAI